MRSSVIYKFSCGGCDAFYLGCTRQRFKACIHQHLDALEKSDLALTNPSHSEPRNHTKKFKHNISVKNLPHCQHRLPFRFKHSRNNAYTQRKAHFKHPSASNRAAHYHVMKKKFGLSHKPPRCCYQSLLRLHAIFFFGFVTQPGYICRRNIIATSFSCQLSTWQHLLKKEKYK